MIIILVLANIVFRVIMEKINFNLFLTFYRTFKKQWKYFHFNKEQQKLPKRLYISNTVFGIPNQYLK